MCGKIPTSLNYQEAFMTDELEFKENKTGAINIKETILLHEKERYDYLYLDDKENLHCLLPLTGGSTIGIDNTCKTLYELRSFFDEENPNCISKVIHRYLTDLDFDIQQLQMNNNSIETDILRGKIARRTQLMAYQEIVMTVARKFKSIGETYPQEILQLFHNKSHPENNLISISLRPEFLDPHVSVPVKQNPDLKEFKKQDFKSHHLFSFNRYGNSFVLTLKEELSKISDTVIQNPARKKEKSLQEKLTAEAQTNYLKLKQEEKGASLNENKTTVIANQQDFEKLEQAMQQAAKTVLFPDLGPDQAMLQAKILLSDTYSTASKNTPEKIQLAFVPTKINLAYLKELIGTDEDEPIALNDAITYWATATIHPQTFDSIHQQQSITVDSTQKSQLAQDPFYEIEANPNKERELISIRLQFLLAMVNVYYCSTEKNSNDFGQIIENDEELQQSLTDYIINEIKKDPAEDITGAIFTFFNQHHKEFQVNNPISSSQQSEIRTLFREQFGFIKNSNHYDEFVLLFNFLGYSFSLNSRISIHLLQIIKQFDDEPSKKYFLSGTEQLGENPPILSSYIQLPETKEKSSGKDFILEPIPSKFAKSVKAHIVLAKDQALSQADIHQLAEQLTSKKASDNSLWIFSLSKEVQEQIKNHPEWPAILNEILLKLSEKDFERLVDKWDLQLNAMPVSSNVTTNVYYRMGTVFFKGTHVSGFYAPQQPGPKLLQKAMQSLLAEKEIEAKITKVEHDKATGAYVIHYDQISLNQYKQISSILKDLDNRFYVSRIMTRALFAEVATRHPEKKLDKKDLFKDAIQTLFPQSKATWRPNGHDGYSSNDASEEEREQIKAIYQAYYLNLPTVELSVEDYKEICQKTGVAVEEQEQDDDIRSVENLVAALSFLRGNVVFESIRLVEEKGSKKFKLTIEDDTQVSGFYVVKKISEQEAKQNNHNLDPNTLYVYSSADGAVHILENINNQVKTRTFDESNPNNSGLHSALENLYNTEGPGVGLIINCAKGTSHTPVKTGICKLESILGKRLERTTNLHMQSSASSNISIPENHQPTPSTMLQNNKLSENNHNLGFRHGFWNNPARKRKLGKGAFEFFVSSISILTAVETAMNYYNTEKTMTSLLEHCSDAWLLTILVIASVLGTASAIAGIKHVGEAIKGNDLVNNPS